VKYLYVEGAVIEVTEEQAKEKVESRQWFACDTTHNNLPEKFKGEDVKVFHREVVRQ